MIRPVQNTPVSTASSAAAISSPVLFIDGVLGLVSNMLRNARARVSGAATKPIRPRKSQSAADTNWLVMRTTFICARVIVMRRSSGAFGRIEIRSSSEESQFIVFNAKSRLPLKFRNEFAAHAALPITTKRPCEFSFPVLYEPAAAIVSGPFLFFGSFGSMSGEFSFVVARLESDELNNFSTVDLPSLLMSIERTSGKPVAVPFISATIGCVAYVVTSATWGPSPASCPIGFKSRIKSFCSVTPQLASSAGQRIVVGDLGAADFQRRIEHDQRAATVFDVFLQRIDFRLLVVARRTANNDNRAIRRNFGLLQQGKSISLRNRLCRAIL